MSTRKITLEERPEIPWLSILFGYGPMLPFVAGAVAAWTSSQWRPAVTVATLLYAASILAFLAGVRRGVSFRTAGGPHVSQILTMLVLHMLALASLVAAWLGAMSIALGLALTGFLLVTVSDPIAARRGTAPLFFVRLRPTQMPIAVLGLVALLAVNWMAR